LFQLQYCLKPPIFILSNAIPKSNCYVTNQQKNENDSKMPYSPRNGKKSAWYGGFCGSVGFAAILW